MPKKISWKKKKKYDNTPKVENNYSPMSHKMLSLKNDLFTQAGKYFIVGGVCTILDVALLFLLAQLL